MKVERVDYAGKPNLIRSGHKMKDGELYMIHKRSCVMIKWLGNWIKLDDQLLIHQIEKESINIWMEIKVQNYVENRR